MLNSNQLAILAADIAADPVFSTYPPGTHAEEIAAAYNLPASPAFYVWRTTIMADEWAMAIIGGGGAHQLDALTASKRDSLLWTCNRTLNVAIPAVRTALEDFCGSQNVLKAAIKAIQYRTCTRAEKLLASGVGTIENPATMTFEGLLTYQDVEAAWQL